MPEHGNLAPAKISFRPNTFYSKIESSKGGKITAVWSFCHIYKLSTFKVDPEIFGTRQFVGQTMMENIDIFVDPKIYI